MEKNILVSVIVPVHNTRDYLRECVESILNQTLKEIEVIFVDDCSTDDSPDIIREYEKKDSRVRGIYLKENVGAGAARNIGLKHATGAYLVFLDADDFFNLNLLKYAYSECKNNDLDMCIYDYAKYDNETHEQIRFMMSNEDMKRFHNKIVSFDEMGDDMMNIWSCAMWTRMIKKRLIDEKGLSFQEIHNANDLFFSYAVLVEAKRVKYIAYEQPLVYYRVNLDNQLSKNREKSPYCTYEALLELFQYFVKKHPEHMRESFYLCLIRHIVNSINNVNSEKRKELLSFYRDTGLYELGVLKAIEEKIYRGHLVKYIYKIRDYDGNDDAFFEYLGNEEEIYHNSGKTAKLIKYFLSNKYTLILWGAGKLGRLFLEECNRNRIEIDYVVDENIQKHGEKIGNHIVSGFEQCTGYEMLVLVTNERWLKSIINRLKDKQFNGMVLDLYSFYALGLEMEDCLYKLDI